MDEEKQFEKARRILHDSGVAPGSSHDDQAANIPHFQIDVNIDGVQLYNNTETGEFIPILFVVHSVSKSFDQPETERVLSRSNPAIVGFYHGKKKPSPKSFLGKFVFELNRLSPFNHDPAITKGREFTVSLRCVRTDGPMRSYLKRTIGHSGYHSCDRCIQPGTQCPVNKAGRYGWTQSGKKTTLQLRDLNAPLRTDEDFFTYTADDDVEDNHVPNVADVSPFADVPQFGLVSGFIIDSMHTMQAGAFGRALFNLVHSKTEGGLSKKSLADIDRRLAIIKQCKPSEFDRHVRPLSKCVNKYKHHELRQVLYYCLLPVLKGVLTKDRLDHIMLLQQSMLLLGGFNPSPVPPSDIKEASRLLKMYVQKCIDYGWPIRFTLHQIIHLPEDVEYYKCGVECLSAYVFENFQRIFKKLLKTGHLPPEQIRNRLVEMSKYVLPSDSNDMLITNYEHVKTEAAKLDVKRNPNQHSNVILEFEDKGIYGKCIKFPHFTISTLFPNNVCTMKNGSVVVCQDIVEMPPKSGVYVVYGHKFKRLEDCYSDPFPSSKYHVQVGSDVIPYIDEWNVNSIAGKIYAIPFNFPSNMKSVPDIVNSKTKWYLSPIFHTVQR